MKALLELLKALYAIRDALREENGNEGGGSNEKSLGYFELTDRPIGVIAADFASPIHYDEEAFIKIEDFVEQLGVPKRERLTYCFVYDKDVSNTINFNTILSYDDVVIANGSLSCDELAPNRFCFHLGGR